MLQIITLSTDRFFYRHHSRRASIKPFGSNFTRAEKPFHFCVTALLLSLLLVTTPVEAFSPIPNNTMPNSKKQKKRTSKESPVTLNKQKNPSDSSSTKARFITNKMCPFAQKAWIALEVGKVPYTLEQISLYGPNGKPDWFWELNPRGEVPVLVVTDDIVLADSDLILNEMGNAVSVDESSSSSFVVESNDDGNNKQQIQKFRKVLSEFLPIGKSAVLGGSKEKMWKKLKELDALIVGPYVCGNDITVADCAGFPFLWRIDNEYGLQDCQNLSAWLKTCEAHPAFAKTVQQSWWWWW